MVIVPARPILAISANWQTRALLAAQVGEITGHDVVSAPGANEALALVKIAGIHPALLVVDAGQQMTREDVERLAAALPDTPLVLSVSALRRTAFDPLREHCAAYLVRPVSIGRIAQAVAQVIAPRQPPPGSLRSG
jgi:DNA-binding NarL/FixJ family response regulator